MIENNINNPEYVKGLFNKMSSSYERMNFITSFGFSIRWRRQFLETIKQTKHKAEIFDLLTGMGETWNATKNKLPNSTLTVLDFSDCMLGSGRLFRQVVNIVFDFEYCCVEPNGNKLGKGWSA